MPSERMQRRIDELLDQAEQAMAALDWSRVQEAAGAVLVVDPDNSDAQGFVAMAEHVIGSGDAGDITSAGPSTSTPEITETASTSNDAPTSFANDRYQVSKFLGEGGNKRVYQVHDTLLDRDVAFALIKTEGFDQTSKERISREAQAMVTCSGGM